MAVYVTHLKRYFNSTELAKRSKHDLSPQLIRDRLRKMGKPKELTEWQYNKVIGPRITRTRQKGTKLVWLNGVQYSASQLSDLYKVSKTTIHNLIAKEGIYLREDMFKFTGHGKQAPKHTLKTFTVKKEEAEDRSPGWAERKYFPDTGKNGFSGGKTSMDRPVRVFF